MKILIVDDDTTFLDKMKKVISISFNHEITIHNDSLRAFKSISENLNEFDLIISDLKMPEMSGIELLRNIRALCDNTIFILVTGYGTIDTAIDSLKEGAFDYITKPFETEKLVSLITEVEKEVLIRKKLHLSSLLPNIEDENHLDSFLRDNVLQSPFLIISNEPNPMKLISHYNLTKATPIWLSTSYEDHSISPSKLYSIKEKILKFATNNVEGTIIFKGLELLIELNGWQNVKNLILKIKIELQRVNNKIQLILLINEDTNLSSVPIYETLGILSDMIVTQMIELFSHPIRNNIIMILNDNSVKTFNNLVKMLNIKSSSILAFHLNKLIEAKAILKTESEYRLSEKGFYLAKAIILLEKLGISSPFSQLKILKTNI